MKLAGVNSFMLSRRFSIVETSVPPGSGITVGPMLTRAILTTLPTTTPPTTAKTFVPMDFKAMASVFTIVFLAELGDKTQLAILGLAADSKALGSVFLGGGGGHDAGDGAGSRRRFHISCGAF